MEINKELAKELLELIKGAKEVAGTVKDFTIEQAPDVIQQLILFHRINELFFAAVGPIMLVVSYKLIVVSLRRLDNGGDDAWLCGLFSGVIGIIAGPAMFFCNISAAIKVWIAPKVFLIEYLSNIVGGK